MLVLVQAVPRDWLVAGEAPLVVDKATTRYGRVSFSLAVSSPAADSGGAYTVTANVTLPPSVGQAGAAQPAGGVVLRIRTPLEHAGKLSGVTVGGKAWSSFNASTETVSFSAAQLTPSLIAAGLQTIVVTFAAATHNVVKTDDDSLSNDGTAQESAAVPCQTDEDCSLNGVCASGLCDCDDGWTTLPHGVNNAMLPGCGYLDFLPVNATECGPAWPVKALFPRPISPKFPVLARACLWCLVASMWRVNLP